MTLWEASYNPKVSVFDKLEMRLNNKLFLQIAPLSATEQLTNYLTSQCVAWQLTSIVQTVKWLLRWSSFNVA